MGVRVKGQRLRQASSQIKGRSKAAKRFKIAIVASRFNPEVCNGLVEGAVCALKEAGFGEKDYTLFRVPGAFEIPLAAKKCIASRRYRGVVALGAVIRGETPHFEAICRAATDGLLRVMLDSGLPVGFGLVTANTLEQAQARSRPDAYNKGREAAVTVLEMVDLLQEVKSQKSKNPPTPPFNKGGEGGI